MHNLALKLFFSEPFLIASASSLCRGLRTGALCSPERGPKPEQLFLPTFAGSQHKPAMTSVILSLGYPSHSCMHVCSSACAKQEPGTSGCHLVSFRSVTSCVWHHPHADLSPVGCRMQLRQKYYVPQHFIVLSSTALCACLSCAKRQYSTQKSKAI